jgi:hypothetical protein
MITNQEVHADASAAGLASLVPEQLLAHPPHTPEQRLMAVRELVRPGGAWYGARARRRAEVQVWLESDDIVWPFSFVNVCEALDLDPGEVRCRLWRPTRGAHRPVRRGCPRRA